MRDADCVGFLQWALPRLGLSWAGFRRVRGQVCKRLGRRIAELGLRDLSSYRVRLDADAEEWAHLDSLCRISISRFYRDREVWSLLQQDILPRIAAQARIRGESRLRIWSAGCASGEEPYTLALIFALTEVPGGCYPEILATDTDSHLLARARRACYPQSSLRGLPSGWQAAFEPMGDEYCLRPACRGTVEFLQQDIRREQPDGPFDLILCRNLVFTYFDQPLQAVIARRLAEVLLAGGVLLLGTHERLPEAAAGLAAGRPWLYRRDTGSGGGRSDARVSREPGGG